MLPKFTVTRSTRSRTEGSDAGKDSSGSPIAPSTNNNNSGSKSSQKKSLKFKIGSSSSLSEISNSQEDSQGKGGGKRNDEKSSDSHRSKRAKVRADEDKKDRDAALNGRSACVLAAAVCLDSDLGGFFSCFVFNSMAEPEKETPEETSEQEQQQSWTDVALDVLDKVMVKDIFVPFNEPVDAIALGIPDYYEVITHPMDFSTVWDNLDKGSYTSPYFFIRDVQRIWANCKKFNEDDSEIVRICIKAEVGTRIRSG